jgi:hypothetical protein
LVLAQKFPPVWEGEGAAMMKIKAGGENDWEGRRHESLIVGSPIRNRL